MSTLFVGIDVSKDSFVACGIDANGNTLFFITGSMDINGFSELVKLITSHSNDLYSALVGMEASGYYHIALFSFLIDK